MHIPVLLPELLNIVKPQTGQVVIDATYGGGGHAKALAAAVGPTGKVLALDRDPVVAKGKVPAANITLLTGSFAQVTALAKSAGIDQVDLVLADLGLSSLQLDDAQRGFSFQEEGPLDMRFDQTTGETAAELLQRIAPAELARLLREYGELPAPLIRELLKVLLPVRGEQTITTTGQLAARIRPTLSHYPWSKREQKHLAQIYQAIRLAVNDELAAIKAFLPQALALLKPGGKLAVISFHSLEDRLIKQFFQKESKGCHCPPSFPVCRCGHQAQLKVLTKKALSPTAEEIAQNSRSRSAKLRVAQKC